MDLWQGTLNDFVRAAESGAIAGDMTGQFVKIHRTPPSVSEIRSWEHSLAALARVARSPRLEDVGVAISASGNALQLKSGARRGASIAAESLLDNVGASTEYHLPLTGRRIDAMFLARDREGIPQAVVVELKQWSSVSIDDEYEANVRVGGVEHPHPCQQALDYASYLGEYHSAFTEGGLRASPLAYCHNLAEPDASTLRADRFTELIRSSPLFAQGQEDELADHLCQRLGGGGGASLLDRVTGGHFQPSAKVIETLEAVIRQNKEWHLLDAQRVAYNAILAEVQRLKGKRKRSAVLIRGGPGTGKTVIAVQLLADALRLGLKAAHSTGGKAFTTTLRSKFKNAKDLFLWNMNLRKAPTQGLDLLLVDEAHRIRKTSNMRFTKRIERSTKSQVEELLDAAKVTVFLLDENQFVRPDEVGETKLVVEATEKLGVPLRIYDLADQFRCGGCTEYVAWVDHLLGFRSEPAAPWGDAYRLDFVDDPRELDAMVQAAAKAEDSARILAGFCWPWSNPNPDGTLEPDVVIGNWSHPWNAKADAKKSYRPDNHPYTLWAETAVGRDQIGCIYSAQGFEFDHVGVIWGPDLLRRDGQWVANKEGSHDRAVRSSDQMERLVRNAYRVLLTRGIRSTTVLCLDAETREHVRQLATGMR